jgi:hypothetical protein
MSELDTAIEDLYQTFGRNPKPSRIEYCPCGCTKADATAKLTSVPLRELPFEDSTDYMFSALFTQGSTDDFRYMLPRLFEGVVRHNYPVDPEILFHKLRYGKWLTWPHEEIEALRSYMRALWTSGLNGFPVHQHLRSFIEIETLLACLANTGEPLETFLAEWTRNQTIAANQNLIEFVTLHGNAFANGGTLTDAFWMCAQEQQGKALRAWILRPDILQRITDNAHLLEQDGVEHLNGMEHLFEPALKTLRLEANSDVAG